MLIFNGSTYEVAFVRATIDDGKDDCTAGVIGYRISVLSIDTPKNASQHTCSICSCHYIRMLCGLNIGGRSGLHHAHRVVIFAQSSCIPARSDKRP